MHEAAHRRLGPCTARLGSVASYARPDAGRSGPTSPRRSLIGLGLKLYELLPWAYPAEIKLKAVA
jgi:hypothetical protein